MFNPIERGRQLREQRQLAKGCGLCGIADNTPETTLYQGMGASAPTAEKLREPADKEARVKIRKPSARHQQGVTRTTTSFPANPQYPQQATAEDVKTILDNLNAVGCELREIEPLARAVMLHMDTQTAAELAVTLDDAFTVAPDNSKARSQCRRLLNDPQALEAAKAVWPGFPSAPANE